MSKARSARAHKRTQPVMPTENTIDFAPNHRVRNIDLIPKSRGQERLILALTDPDTDIVVTAGPAGTGKTYLAMLAAVRALRQGQVQRLVLTRPAVGVEDEQHGFLPGDLVSKMEPWTRPLLDVIREYYRPCDIARMIDDQVVEISPLAYMRGRSFKNAWIIADEMQNATPNQMKMLLTRIGQGSRITVTGDVDQTDRTQRENGLLDIMERMSSCNVNGLSLVKLETRDIQRHPIIDSVLKLYA